MVVLGLYFQLVKFRVNEGWVLCVIVDLDEMGERILVALVHG